MSVVLPAPFSPTRAWIEPRRTESDTRSLATRRPKVLVTSRSSTAGVTAPLSPEAGSAVNRARARFFWLMPDPDLVCSPAARAGCPRPRRSNEIGDAPLFVRLSRSTRAGRARSADRARRLQRRFGRDDLRHPERPQTGLRLVAARGHPRRPPGAA